jgi:spore germination protein KA
MFRKFVHRLKRRIFRQVLEGPFDLAEAADELGQLKISADLESNMAELKKIYYRCDDIVMRRFEIGTQRVAGLLIYLEGFVDKNRVSDIMNALMLQSRLTDPDRKMTPDQSFDLVANQCLVSSEITRADNLQQVTQGIFTGKLALFIDGVARAVLSDIKAYEHRDVAMPETEVVVRGPREGFIEELVTNLILIRRRIKGPQLKIEKIVLGEQSATSVAIAYVNGIADEKIVEEARRRLQRIDIDAVLDSGYLEEYIEDAPYSPFPTVGNTEKPDVAAAKLLEGRVAILADGSPFVLIVPHLLVEAFQVSEDYYSRPFYTSMTRFIRIASFMITLLLPAIYVAAQAYHPELIPAILIVRMAGAREGIPFPAWLEALLMLAIFELLKEAGLRMPRAVGQAVAIVGTLVLGDAAIRSGIVTPAMVIVVALTSIAGFVIPPESESISVLRFPLLVAGSILGLFGVVLLVFVIVAHGVSLRSFGVPYTSPLAPAAYGEWKDVFIRAPWPWMLRRPRAIVRRNLRRQAAGQVPQPAKGKTGPPSGEKEG